MTYYKQTQQSKIKGGQSLNLLIIGKTEMCSVASKTQNGGKSCHVEHWFFFWLTVGSCQFNTVRMECFPEGPQ